MIQIIDSFDLKSRRPNFTRDQFETMDSMKAVADSDIDDGHIAFCVQTNKTYIYHASNEYTAATGKWRILTITKYTTSDSYGNKSEESEGFNGSVDIKLPKKIKAVVYAEEGSTLPLIGTLNLVLNSGFNGDYMTLQLDPGTEVVEGTELWNTHMNHWEVSNVTLVRDSVPKSGFYAELEDGSLTQYFTGGFIVDQSYVLSFIYKGTIGVTFQGETHTVYSDIWKSVSFLIKAVTSTPTLVFKGSGCLSEISVTVGTVPVDWQPSFLDVKDALSEYYDLSYIRRYFTENDTNSISLEAVLELNEKAGIVGKIEDHLYPVLYAGGTLEDAVNVLASSEYKGWSPSMYQKKMFGCIIGQNGTVILNDTRLYGKIQIMPETWTTPNAAHPGEVFLDSGVLRVNVEAAKDFPAEKKLGSCYFDPKTRRPYWWDGNDWVSPYQWVKRDYTLIK